MYLHVGHYIEASDRMTIFMLSSSGTTTIAVDVTFCVGRDTRPRVASTAIEELPPNLLSFLLFVDLIWRFL